MLQAFQTPSTIYEIHTQMHIMHILCTMFNSTCAIFTKTAKICREMMLNSYEAAWGRGGGEEEAADVYTNHNRRMDGRGNT